jgi:hypothetical protein
MIYKGRTSSPAATNPAHAIDGVAFEDTFATTCNMVDVAKGRDTVTFKIPNPKDSTSKAFDRASNARYQIVARVFYTLESNTGSTTAEQVGVASKEVLYNETWFAADSMKGQYYTEERLRDLENGS